MGIDGLHMTRHIHYIPPDLAANFYTGKRGVYIAELTDKVGSNGISATELA